MSDLQSASRSIKIRQKVESLSTNCIIVVRGASASDVSLAAALQEIDLVRKKELKFKVIDFAAAVLPVQEVRRAATAKNVLDAKGVQIILGKG